jgi:tetratricopeptide (TPR) repeat protein
MRKTATLLFILFSLGLRGIAQKDTVTVQKGTDTTIITGKQANKLVKQLVKATIDTSKFLSQSGEDACKCIDSISVSEKGSNEISKEIAGCIHKEVESYQLALKIYHNMVDGGNVISLNTEKDSREYKRYYFEIESWLRDSCKSLNKIVDSDNKESEVSVSKNESAMAAYNRGVEAMEKEQNKDAADYFATAVSLDSMFAFAWDNLGLSYRKLGKYDEALAAYKKSLSIDPKGKLPLQNIPVVYEYKKDYDKALEAYLSIHDIYPDDPEAWYGSGRIYIYYKEDFEKALDNMCKAYNIYTKTNSPYRVDAEKQINYIYSKMKAAGNEKLFNKILKENHISTGSN